MLESTDALRSVGCSGDGVFGFLWARPCHHPSSWSYGAEPGLKAAHEMWHPRHLWRQGFKTFVSFHFSNQDYMKLDKKHRIVSMLQGKVAIPLAFLFWPIGHLLRNLVKIWNGTGNCASRTFLHFLVVHWLQRNLQQLRTPDTSDELHDSYCAKRVTVLKFTLKVVILIVLFRRSKKTRDLSPLTACCVLHVSLWKQTVISECLTSLKSAQRLYERIWTRYFIQAPGPASPKNWMKLVLTLDSIWCKYM